MHALRRLQKSLIALMIVVCGKSSQIYCSVRFSSGMVFEVCELLEASHLLTHGTAEVC